MVQVQMSTAGSRFVNSFVIQNIKLKPEKDSISFKLYVGILRIEDVWKTTSTYYFRYMNYIYSGLHIVPTSEIICFFGQVSCS